MIDINRTIILSIKPIHMNNIVNGIKTFEFRNYIPKDNFNYIYVYVTKPIGKLKYLIRVDNIIKYPEKIEKSGLGNKEFNLGLKSVYTYEVSKLYEIENSINLEDLKNTYKFTPPQGYVYAKSNIKLFEDLQKKKLNILK